METLLIAICVAAFLLAVVVFSPVVIAVDSREQQLRVRWLLTLEFQIPLPWTEGRKFFKAFGKPFLIPEKQAAATKKEKPAGTGVTVQKFGKRRSAGRFFVRCLGDSGIRRALARQLSVLLRRIFSSVDLRGLASDVSLPDPALNGLLAGALAVTNPGRRQAIRVNFKGENSLLLELRFHPHRIFKAFLYFLPGLPYRAVFRQWRAFSAARPH
ncbi:MAG TPA: hypothetical protein VJW77_00520 [Terriglobia bacterium]|nr:hypothetical protein [Terriglobia bacterium]